MLFDIMLTEIRSTTGEQHLKTQQWQSTWIKWTAYMHFL